MLTLILEIHNNKSYNSLVWFSNAFSMLIHIQLQSVFANLTEFTFPTWAGHFTMLSKLVDEGGGVTSLLAPAGGLGHPSYSLAHLDVCSTGSIAGAPLILFSREHSRPGWSRACCHCPPFQACQVRQELQARVRRTSSRGRCRPSTPRCCQRWWG